jgi:16S rRNA (cytidine1402-2'-O)-methyltransferase
VAPLFVIGTPIGNLGDITLRAIDTLREVKHVAAEDTRRTRQLLSHLEVHGKHLVALDAHASEKRIAGLVDRLVAGESVALVTDAGMPSVSDPGAALVRAAVERGVEVTAIPGPSAVTAAVALSGLVEGPFLFLGFLPRRGQKRHEAIERIARSVEPVVLFESPNRTQHTLDELAGAMPERQASVSRELTKLHEETVRGTLAELSTRSEWRGEIAIVLGPGDGERAEAPDDAALDARIGELLAEGVSPRSVADELTAWSRRPRREVYARVQKLRRGQ